jgi:hypothetical protein
LRFVGSPLLTLRDLLLTLKGGFLLLKAMIEFSHL